MMMSSVVGVDRSDAGMEVDPIAEVYIVTIHVPRLDDFDVDFDSLEGANDFIEFMKAADVRGW